VSVEYVELADYLAIAAEVTGLDIETIIKVTKLDLADSALHAPAAGFGETELYPDFVERPPCSWCGSSRTIRCRTATSGRRG